MKLNIQYFQSCNQLYSLNSRSIFKIEKRKCFYCYLFSLMWFQCLIHIYTPLLFTFVLSLCESFFSIFLVQKVLKRGLLCLQQTHVKHELLSHLQGPVLSCKYVFYCDANSLQNGKLPAPQDTHCFTQAVHSDVADKKPD